MRRKNTFYKATALAMTSVLTLGAPVIAHAENTEGTDLSDEGYPEINPEIATLENQELEIWLPEYSRAMKSHFRKFGNQMSGSGNHLCNYASLLA